MELKSLPKRLYEDIVRMNWFNNIYALLYLPKEECGHESVMDGWMTLKNYGIIQCEQIRKK